MSHCWCQESESREKSSGVGIDLSELKGVHQREVVSIATNPLSAFMDTGDILMADTHDIVAEAYAVLETIRETQFPNRPLYLYPHKFLSALLRHAPNSEGQLEIAKDILAATPDDIVNRLIKLSDYFFYNLVLSCTLRRMLANWKCGLRAGKLPPHRIIPQDGASLLIIGPSTVASTSARKSFIFLISF